MSETIDQWFRDHAADYETVQQRLDRTRAVLLEGDISDAADVLEKSYMFAVLSIRTERSRHERAFTAHYAGDLSRKEAALETVYGGNKKNWIARTFDSTDWEALARAVRAHVRANDRYADLLDAVVDQLTGVAYRKGAFMLAMSGLHEYGCIDSNVARYAESSQLIDEEDPERKEFSNAQHYMSVCGDVFDSVPTERPPFVKQWAIYDYERGEHARHMAFFHELPVPINRIGT